MGTNYRQQYFQRTGRDLTHDIKTEQLGRLQWAWREADEDMRAEFMVWAGIWEEPAPFGTPPSSRQGTSDAIARANG